MVLEVPFNPPGGDEWLWFPAGASFDGPSVALQGAGPMRVLKDVQGHEAPVFSYSSTSTPGVDAVDFGEVSASRPRLVLPVLLYAASPEHLDAVKSELISSLVPKRGTGRLMRTVGIGQEPGEGEVSGRARYVWARYRSGLEGDGAAVGPRWWRFTVTFEAQDPFWYSVDPIRATWRGFPSSSFFPVRFPLRFSRSGLAVDSELQVQGDGETWPSFDLVGPLSRIRVRPSDDDEAFWEITRSLSSTEMLRVVTRPNEETVTAWVSDGAGGWVPAAEPNAYMALHPESWFTPLSFGSELLLEANGTASSTAVELTAEEAWWSM